MKKLMAVFVLALFIISMVPLAFAEDTETDDSTADAPARGRGQRALENRERLIEAKDALLEKHQERIAELVEKCTENNIPEDDCKARFENRLQNIAALAPRFREKLQQFEQRRAERIQKLKELRNDEVFGKMQRANDFRARALSKDKIAKAQAALVKAKERFMEARAGLDKAQLRLEQAKTSRVCNASPNSTECEKAREELRASAKEKMLNQADIIISSLENAKEKVAASEYLTDEEEKTALEFLDAQLTKFNEIKADIEKAATKEEIVAAGKKLAEAWKEAKQKVNAYLSFAANARMAGIVVKAEHLAAKLERVMERMAENGKDTDAVEPLVAEFKAKIELAKAKFKSAHSLLLEVRTSELSEEQKKAKLDEANTLLKDAKQALQDANAKLREIFQKLKEVGATQELADATAAEDVEAEAEENATEESD